MLTLILPATLDVPAGADVKTYTVAPGHTFGPCSWCAYEPCQPATITVMWDSKRSDNDGHEECCVGCATQVIAQADCYPDQMTIEYPIIQAPAVKA